MYEHFTAKKYPREGQNSNALFNTSNIAHSLSIVASFNVWLLKIHGIWRYLEYLVIVKTDKILGLLCVCLLLLSKLSEHSSSLIHRHSKVQLNGHRTL